MPIRFPNIGTDQECQTRSKNARSSMSERLVIDLHRQVRVDKDTCAWRIARAWRYRVNKEGLGNGNPQAEFRVTAIVGV